MKQKHMISREILKKVIIKHIGVYQDKRKGKFYIDLNVEELAASITDIVYKSYRLKTESEIRIDKQQDEEDSKVFTITLVESKLPTNPKVKTQIAKEFKVTDRVMQKSLKEYAAREGLIYIKKENTIVLYAANEVRLLEAKDLDWLRQNDSMINEAHQDMDVRDKAFPES